MLCPQCGEVLLTYEYQLIETDHCAACGGIWLDRGELEELARSGAGDDTRVADALKNAVVLKHTERLCPICRKKMEVLGIGAEPRIEIDHCRLGHGLWFDKEELRRIIERISPEQANPVVSYFADLCQSELKME